MNLYSHLKLLGLGHLYTWVMENNSGATNPYHGNFHIERVTQFVLTGATFYNLTFQDHVFLATAALLHDINHSGGKFKNDADNVKLALDALEIYFSQHNDTLQFSRADLDVIADIIRATQYPYEKSGDSLNLLQKIMRDSDVVQGPYSESYLTSIVRALAIELSIPYEKAIDMQISFYKSLRYETEWGNDLMEKAYPIIEEQCKVMKDLIQSK